MMKKFIKDIVLFLLPFLILASCSVPFYLEALNCGEFSDIIDNIEVQRENHNIIIGLGYNEQTSYYKLVNANYYEADIIALGTSRVMQFKDVFFEKDFYNCGGAVGGNYDEYVNFLKNMEYKPECILLGLDAWVFNDAWNQSKGDYSSFIKIRETNRSKRAMLKSIIWDWIDGKWSFADLECYTDNIGFNGRIKDNGFMYDGSYYYGDTYRDPEGQEDYLFVNTLDRIETGTRNFEWGDHIDQDSLVQLENLLSYCEGNGIYVIGFLAPFAPTVYIAMSESDNYKYMTEIESACFELFNGHGFEFYNYIDGVCLDVTDDYFIDGFHGSEIVYGYILEDMILNNSIVNEYVDLSNIQYLLENSYDKRTFYNPDTRSIE